MNSKGCDSSLLRCAVIVCTTLVTVVDDENWLCVSVRDSAASIARTGPAAAIGNDPDQGTGTARTVPDATVPDDSCVPCARRSTRPSGSVTLFAP